MLSRHVTNYLIAKAAAEVDIDLDWTGLDWTRFPRAVRVICLRAADSVAPSL
ncbi:hypothetical protein ACIPC1_19410 [Streptomyces sp. NPDC087263]|uniref:hypothetical protein n=1 Tax=Streptomyces sp. NPDC087263 TaxID=3365773 RepID=UPI00382BBD5D